MNSAMMPTQGFYNLVQISREEFKGVLIAAASSDQLASYIGYAQNIELIQEMTGIRPALNYSKTEVNDGDTLLIMTLKYRKGRGKGERVAPDDFEYYLAQYRASI